VLFKQNVQQKDEKEGKMSARRAREVKKKGKNGEVAMRGSRKSK
jgi:hypothetical protein